MTRERLEHPEGQGLLSKQDETESESSSVNMRRDGERTCGIAPPPPPGRGCVRAARAAKIHGSSGSHVGK